MQFKIWIFSGGSRKKEQETPKDRSPEVEKELAKEMIVESQQTSPEAPSLLGLNWLFEHSDSDTENSKAAAARE